MCNGLRCSLSLSLSRTLARGCCNERISLSRSLDTTLPTRLLFPFGLDKERRSGGDLSDTDSPVPSTPRVGMPPSSLGSAVFSGTRQAQFALPFATTTAPVTQKDERRERQEQERERFKGGGWKRKGCAFLSSRPRTTALSTLVPPLSWGASRTFGRYIYSIRRGSGSSQSGSGSSPQGQPVAIR